MFESRANSFSLEKDVLLDTYAWLRTCAFSYALDLFTTFEPI